MSTYQKAIKALEDCIDQSRLFSDWSSWPKSVLVGDVNGVRVMLADYNFHRGTTKSKMFFALRAQKKGYNKKFSKQKGMQQIQNFSSRCARKKRYNKTS